MGDRKHLNQDMSLLQYSGQLEEIKWCCPRREGVYKKASWPPYPPISNRVEWFRPFCNFRKETHFCRSGILLGVQFQKIGNFCRARARRTRGKVFIFRKSLCASKNNRQKENSILKFFNYFFFFPKMGKTVLTIVNKIYKVLGQVNKQHWNGKFWNWGPTVKQLGTTWQVSNFFSSKSLHPNQQQLATISHRKTDII